MKILFFSTYFYPYISGITTYPYKILSNLAKNNKVTVLTFPHQIRLSSEQKINDFIIKRIPYLFKISKGFISPQSIIYFFNNIEETDIVFLNIPNFEGLFLAVLAKFFGKKTISIFHCEVDLGKGLLNRIINFFLNLSVYIQLYLSDIIVVYTHDYVTHTSVGKLFKNKIKFTLPPVEKLAVSNLEISNFKKLKRNKIWIGYAGRISKEKGLEYLIQAISNFKFQNLKFQVVFAGPYGKDVAGEYEYFLKLKKLLEINKISYKFFGNLSKGNLGAFYKNIDLLVLPSINKTEAFGMVQVEAMLMGTPVIASNLPGVRIPIRKTGMGIIVNPEKSVEIKIAIKKILADKNKYTNEKSVERAGHIFDINKVYEFYSSLLLSFNNKSIGKQF